MLEPVQYSQISKQILKIQYQHYSSKADLKKSGGFLQFQLRSKTTKILSIKFVNTLVM